MPFCGTTSTINLHLEHYPNIGSPIKKLLNLEPLCTKYHSKVHDKHLEDEQLEVSNFSTKALIDIRGKKKHKRIKKFFINREKEILNKKKKIKKLHSKSGLSWVS
jgi:hypothetical protein